MNRLILLVCVLLASFASIYPCVADGVNGVICEERVINLPQDQGGWYISVVGAIGDANYQRVLGWFNTDAKMKKLRDTVHFCPVATDTAIYRERYAMTTGLYKITALPCVRLQRSDGSVVYQACGKNIPMTSQGLYGALANGVQMSEGIFPILPWRREMERRCPCPQPNPNPNPNPDPDPEPQPIGPPDAPDVPEVESDLPPVWLIVLMLVAGVGAGVAYQWKKTYAKK
jgi:hypothetical protein